MEKKNLTGQILEKEMKFEVNYKGEEFNNFVNLTALNKRLIAIDKIIKVSLKTLVKTKQIKNGKNAIDQQTNIKIKQKINELKENIDIEEIPETLIGQILRLDIEKDKYIIKLDNGLSVPLEFADVVDFEDIRPVLKHKIVIECISQYDNGELKEIKVLEFRLARQPKLNDYSK